MWEVFTNDPGDLGSIPGCVIPKTLKVVLDTSLLNTQQYKVLIKGKKKLATIVEGNPKAPFSIATTPMCRGGCYSFPGLLYLQGGIKNHFLSLLYDSTWD